MTPILNIADITDYQQNDDGAFQEQCAPISDHIGARKLGYNVVILQPGFKACPFHNHHINEEMFLVLEGSGTLRFGSATFAIGKDDIIACPPGGKSVAHQIINSSDQPLKYLALSTNEPYEICEYPDSNKVLSMVGDQAQPRFSHISRLTDGVDYFEDEQ
jgi:uncharacterized cupin superfamily protein